MNTREQIVAEARSWIGTPYRHQGGVHRQGIDCGGLIRESLIGIGKFPKDWKTLPIYQQFIGYGRNPDGTLPFLASMHFKEIPLTDMQPGDVVLMVIAGGPPRHVGILGSHRDGGLSLIHAIQNTNCCEHRLDEKWRKRIVAAFTLGDDAEPVGAGFDDVPSR